MSQPPSMKPIGPVGVFATLIGLIPLGIGITVLVFLWGAPFNAWDSPPIFFRVFGSFIALAFVLFGGAMLAGALRGAQPGSAIVDRAFSELDTTNTAMPKPASAQSPGGAYECPQCGAPLAGNAEVSPHGDAKCGHCASWFNIHGRG
ncbi:MAG: hypothetical protein ACHRHE_06510 [Tepidisphaerales bacterium]